MTERFEVGQKVRIHEDVEGEVTYGPFRSTYGTYTGYVVRIGETEQLQRESDLSSIPKQPKFIIGDKVKARFGTTYTVEAGPFFAPGEWYALKVDGSGDVVHSHADEVSLVESVTIKVGDKVRVLDDDGGGTHRFVGRVGVVKKCHGDDADLPYLVEFGDGRGGHGDENGQWNCRAVERVTDEDTYEHDGVVYDLEAKYLDSDLDTVRLKKVGGVVRAAFYGEEPDVNSRPLEEVVDRWGPLTRVTD